MAMSRKHYRQAAELIRGVIESLEGETSEGERLGGHYPNGEAHDKVVEIVHGLADMFRADNSNFRRDQFLSACGL